VAELARPLLFVDTSSTAPLAQRGATITHMTGKRKPSVNYRQNDRNRKHRRIQPSSSSQTFRRRLVNHRTFLLAISLTLILSVFWLLDSIKDPTFAILCDGDLKRHQPLAKMASVAGTLFLVVLMEVITHYRDRRRRQWLRQRRRCGDAGGVTRADGDVLDAGGVWTKMEIGSGADGGIEKDDDGDAPGRIPISVFRTVGVVYIVVFLGVAHLLSLHPDLQGRQRGTDTGEATTAVFVDRGSLMWYALGYAQYMLIESYGSISVATFWSFVNSTLSLKAAKVYYGFIIAMAQIGAIGGSTIATFQDVSKPALMVVACIGIVLQMGVMQLYGNNFPHAMVEGDDAVIDDQSAHTDDYAAELEANAQQAQRKLQRAAAAARLADNSAATSTTKDPRAFVSGLHLVLRHDYLLLILGVSCLYEISLTCLDYQMKLIGLDRFSSPDFGNDVASPEEMGDRTGASFAVFMGRYGQLTNLLSLLLSYYAFPYLMEKYGLSHTIRVFPSLLLMITLMAFIALPMNLPVLFVSMSLLKALTYSINDPAKEILYIPTSNVVKFKAKFWIDVVGARIAKAIGSGINTYAGTAEGVVKYGSVPSVVSAGALWIICYAAGMRFDSLLKAGEIVGVEEDENIDQMDLLSHYDDGDDDDDDGCGNNNDVTDDENGDPWCGDNFMENDGNSDTDWDSSASIELVQGKSP